MQLIFSTPGGCHLATATDLDIKEGRVVKVENNFYLDSTLVDMTNLTVKGEGKNYTCPIKKGTCDYYSFDDGKEQIDELAWIYPKVDNTLYSEIDGKVAFWKGKFVMEEKE
jgi:uncharacterized protein (DUF427 family)